MNENENEVVEQTTQQSTNEYLEAIKQLKSTTVSKDEYEALKQERNTLLENLVNGQFVSTETAEPEVRPDIKELRKELFKPDHELNDIEYVTRALALRKAVMEETGKDCFVGASHAYTPTSEDYEKAQRVADVLQSCIDDSNGNNGKFVAELSARLNDTFIPRRK